MSSEGKVQSRKKSESHAFTSFFFYYFLYISCTPDEDNVSKALVFLNVLYVSSYR